MTNNTIFDDVFRTMAVRMVEYDFAIALEHRKKVVLCQEKVQIKYNQFSLFM